MTDSNVTKELEKKLLSFITEEDPMLSMLQWITEKFMEIEVANKVGAQKGRHSTERTTHLSGTRVRRFDTRMGTMYLTIPKLRKGGYIPFFVTAKKRSEQALMQIIQEAWVSGISTRKIERLAKSMGIEQISASQVSEVNKELDAMVEEFRNRSLQAEYPILWIDALYEKIRENGHIVSMAVLVVKGVTLDGTAQILAVEPMHNESEGTYRILFQNLKDRGVNRVWLCISDAHKGLQAAIRKEFMEHHGNDAKFISCAIFLHMWDIVIRIALPSSSSTSGCSLMKSKLAPMPSHSWNPMKNNFLKQSAVWKRDWRILCNSIDSIRSTIARYPPPTPWND